tara:strand:+ start:319 stop:894 length:576 start_codon:yes stop_codon:yes gene_type:complete
MEDKTFKPIILSFNKLNYQRACKEAEEKLHLLDQMLVWCARNGAYIKTKGLMSSFLLDPVQTFKDEWYRIHSKKIELKVNLDKLLELTEVYVSELQSLEEKYRKLNAFISIVNDNKSKLFKYASVVNKEDYYVYTKSEKENEKVLKLKKFLASLKEVEEFTSVYPAHIQSGLSNAVRYDISENEYVISEFS